MEADDKKFQEVLRRRQMTYKWRYPEGTKNNYKVRDPAQPQESLVGIWHRVENKATKEAYYEKYRIVHFLLDLQFIRLIFEGFGPELHEENYKVKGMETGSRQYYSFPQDVERETVIICLSADRLAISFRLKPSLD